MPALPTSAALPALPEFSHEVPAGTDIPPGVPYVVERPDGRVTRHRSAGPFGLTAGTSGYRYFTTEPLTVGAGA